MVFDSPHSGREYPPDFPARASEGELRRAEDAYVDELISGTIEAGACVLAANFGRCYIDVNRAETDIDPELLSGPWPGEIAPTEKSRKGLGLIRRYVLPGIEVYSRRLTPTDVQHRIESVYRPYHAELARLIGDVRRADGRVVHVNWHSMKSRGNAMTPDGEGATRSDFVISDLEGRSAEPQVTAWIARALRESGHSVSVNDPYKGGEIIRRHGNPAKGVHSIQIEINRRLYLDETTVSRSSGFATLKGEVEALSRSLADYARSLA
jgi:N-formylglutamate deformylase